MFPPPTQLAAWAGDVVRGWASPASWQKKTSLPWGKRSACHPTRFSFFPTSNVSGGGAFSTRVKLDLPPPGRVPNTHTDIHPDFLSRVLRASKAPEGFRSRNEPARHPRPPRRPAAWPCPIGGWWEGGGGWTKLAHNNMRTLAHAHTHTHNNPPTHAHIAPLTHALTIAAHMHGHLRSGISSRHHSSH